VDYPDEAIFTTYAEQRKPNQGILKCPSDTTTNAWGGPTSVPYAYNGTFYGLGVNDYFTEPDADFFYGPIYAAGFGRQRSPSIIRPSTTVLVADINAQDGYEYSGYRLSNWNAGPTAYDSLATYHHGASNILWVDGHATTRKVATMTANDFDRRY
jgi:prepilin-type processing-associated H-X9-DG protein